MSGGQADFKASRCLEQDAPRGLGRAQLAAGRGGDRLCRYRKSSIIVAADESTISWGPSPTFGELVSWPLLGEAGADP